MTALPIRLRITILVALAAAVALGLFAVGAIGAVEETVTDFSVSTSNDALAGTESAVETAIADVRLLLGERFDIATNRERQAEIPGLIDEREAEIDRLETEIDALDPDDGDGPEPDGRAPLEDRISRQEDQIRQLEDEARSLDLASDEEVRGRLDHLGRLSEDTGVSIFDGDGDRIAVGDLETQIGASSPAVLARIVCRFVAGSETCDVEDELSSAGTDGDTTELIATLERLAQSEIAELALDVPAVTIGEVVEIGDQRFILMGTRDITAEIRSETSVGPFVVVLVPVVTLLLAGITWLVLGRALRPVRAMTDQVAGISEANLDQHIVVPAANDELRRLAQTMNDMLGRLRESRSRQRRFISDASHELRSPITATQATLEVAAADPDGADWPNAATVLAEENARLASLVDDLLLLARLDEELDGERVVNGATAVDLDEVCLAEAARPRSLEPIVQVQSPARVAGSLAMLTRAVRNMIDNAAVHADSRVEVSVGVEESRGTRHAVVWVDDDGPGIPPDQRATVFERFTRLDEARDRSGGGGAGLGLAIVKSIAENHSGSVRVEDSALGGARLVLSLPVEEPAVAD